MINLVVVYNGNLYILHSLLLFLEIVRWILKKRKKSQMKYKLDRFNCRWIIKHVESFIFVFSFVYEHFLCCDMWMLNWMCWEVFYFKIYQVLSCCITIFWCGFESTEIILLSQIKSEINYPQIIWLIFSLFLDQQLEYN